MKLSNISEMDPTGTEYAALLARVLAKTWWELEDVAVYIRKSPGAAKIWMYRRGVRKCATDRSKTCKAWIDAALNRNNK
jgi:hypothetical protein